MAAKTEITSLLKLFSLHCVNITASRTELHGEKKIFPGLPLDLFFFSDQALSLLACRTQQTEDPNISK